jgi:hypothetical protein
MWIDIVANFPLSTMAIILGWKSLKSLRLIHLVRVLRLPSYFERIEGYLLITIQFRIGAATKLLARVFLLYFLAIHFFSCSWFAIHRFLERGVQYTWATTDCPGGQTFATKGCLSSWVEQDNNHDICYDEMIAKCYVRSFYFVLTTMSSVGYGTYNVEIQIFISDISNFQIRITLKEIYHLSPNLKPFSRTLL